MDALDADGWLPAVLGLKQSRTLGDLVRVVGLLVEWSHDPRDEGLKRVFADWVRHRTGHWKHGRALLRRQEAPRFGVMIAEH